MADTDRDRELTGSAIQPLNLEDLRQLDPDAFAETSFGSTPMPVGDHRASEKGATKDRSGDTKDKKGG